MEDVTQASADSLPSYRELGDCLSLSALEPGYFS